MVKQRRNTFDNILYRGSTKNFWESFGRTINFALSRRGLVPKGPTTFISSQADLKSYFRKDSWDRDVVFLLDEFSCLYQAAHDVRADCLWAFRGLKQNHGKHAVQCLVAAGTFFNLNLLTGVLSPFNDVDLVHCPYFTIDEIRKLFREFAQDLSIPIEDDIAVDVWAKSNGLVAQLDCV